MTNVPQIGDRVRLIAMPNDPDPIPTGALGTVVSIHNHGRWIQIEVDWDNGRALMLSLPDDQIEILEPDQRLQSK